MNSKYMVFMGLGFELVFLIIGGLMLGQKLDDLWGTRGIMVIVILVCCLISWFVHLIFLLKRVEKIDGSADE